MFPAWAEHYIGREFAEGGRGEDGRYDCWGLVREVLGHEFGVYLPSYRESYRTLLDITAISFMLTQAITSLEWHLVRTETVRPGDVVLFQIKGQPFHVALVVAPGYMLHIRKGTNACIERWDAVGWNTRRLGFYRHTELMTA